MIQFIILVFSSLVAVSLGFLLYLERSRSQESKARIRELETKLESAIKERQAERKGRIRAQQELRQNVMGSDPSSNGYPLNPIGVLRSCFSKRNGTPRQPLLVPSARACLELTQSTLSPSTLEGLSSYSHCWILYLFHANTNIERLWKKNPFLNIPSKINVPRLNGKKLGVFATRSPHRPNPIGLSIAKAST